jgi:hypothetical protein
MSILRRRRFGRHFFRDWHDHRGHAEFGQAEYEGQTRCACSTESFLGTVVGSGAFSPSSMSLTMLQNMHNTRPRATPRERSMGILLQAAPRRNHLRAGAPQFLSKACGKLLFAGPNAGAPVALPTGRRNPLERDMTAIPLDAAPPSAKARPRRAASKAPVR